MVTQKKPLNSVAIGVGVLSVILLIAIAAIYLNYNSLLNGKDSKINDLNAQIDVLNSQTADMQNQINSLKGANVIGVNLKATDDRPYFGTPDLHVTGYVCNVGNNIAPNIYLHVVGYQSGGVKAFDTTITVGTLGGHEWQGVDSKISYTGNAITNYDITPQWG
jgi:hypothetical protein